MGQSLDDSLEEISIFYDRFLGFFEKLEEKSVEDYLSPTFQESKAELQKAWMLVQHVRSMRRTLEPKVKRMQDNQSLSATEEEKLRDALQKFEKIKSCQERLNEIQVIWQRFSLFEAEKQNQILNRRSAVPQQFAMIGSFEAPEADINQQDQFLVATHGLGPCVGVSFYCVEQHLGMVAHLDDTHRVDKAHPESEGYLSSYFDRLLDAMQLGENATCKATMVISRTDHHSLDIHVYEALAKQDRIFSVEKKEVNNSAACLLLNLKDGNVVTDYKEREFKTQEQLGMALNASRGFKLFHLRDGAIHEQALFDQSSAYQIDETGILVPHDKQLQTEILETQSDIAQSELSNQTQSQTPMPQLAENVQEQGENTLFQESPELGVRNLPRNRNIQNAMSDFRRRLIDAAFRSIGNIRRFPRSIIRSRSTINSGDQMPGDPLS